MKKEGGGVVTCLKIHVIVSLFTPLPKTIRAFLKTHSTFIHKNAVWTI